MPMVPEALEVLQNQQAPREQLSREVLLKEALLRLRGALLRRQKEGRKRGKAARASGPFPRSIVGFNQRRSNKLTPGCSALTNEVVLAHEPPVFSVKTGA